MVGRESLGRRLLVLGAVWALMLRALVPAGWMPGPAAGGGLELIPCRATAPAPAPAPVGAHAGHSAHQKQPSHEGHQGEGDQPCAFGGLSLSWTWAEAPLLPPALVPPAPPIEGLRRGVEPVRGLAAPPPPATGPPLD